ncbi:MAG: hypothetical protein ACE5OR_05885 [bacterium]
METINQLLSEVDKALSKYSYYRKREILSQGKSYVKLRLYIDKNLFVQVNRNEKAGLTNLVLIQNMRRIFGRDGYKGSWHRQPASDPDFHNRSSAGKRKVAFREFLEEVDRVLKDKGLM